MSIGLIDDESTLVSVSALFRQAIIEFDPKPCRQVAWPSHSELILGFSHYDTFGIQKSPIQIFRKWDIWGEHHVLKLQIHNTYFSSKLYCRLFSLNLLRVN